LLKNFEIFLKVGVGDLVLLPDTSLPFILKNLKDRHGAGQIYTYIGEVCINVNPYKSLDIYGQPVVNHYKVKQTVFLKVKMLNWLIRW